MKNHRKNYFWDELKNMSRHLPNLFTCMNLFCGSIATVLIFRNHLDWAAYVILAAAFFDLMDGLMARYLEVHSPFGKELDSLADVVSFGLVPALMLFKLFQSSGMDSIISGETTWRFLQFFPFILVLFSALRLAKFNLDTRQSDSFIGLPTPASTLFVISLPLILLQFPGRYDAIILNPWFLMVTTLTLSLLLVSEIPLFSMKFKNFGFRENRYQYILLVIAAVLVPVFYFASIPMIIFFYLLLSIIQNRMDKEKLNTQK